MTTAIDIVRRAFRKIGVLAVDTQPSADQHQDGIDTLNMMLHEWKLRGVDIAHTDLAASDTFPLSSEYELGTVYLLAAALSPNYEVPASFNADDFFRAMQAAYITVSAVTLPKAMTLLPSRNAHDWPLQSS